MYSIYLRAPDQSISERTDTTDRGIALAAFEALLAHREFDGSAMRAILNLDQISLAHHRFNCQAGSDDYWRGRVHLLDHINLHTRDRGADGGRLICVFLDGKAIRRAELLGQGDMALGVHRALKHLMDNMAERPDGHAGNGRACIA